MLIANLPACWGSLSDIFLANLLLYSSFPDFKAVAYGFFLVVEQWRKACLMPCCAVYLGERDVSLVGFEMNDKAEVVNEWFGKTVIRSDRRFAYEQAQQVIETGSGDCCDEILSLWALAEQMRKRRFRAGAINFESIEVKFHLDENAKPTGVYLKESKEANWLIEEFMLLANRQVAAHIGKAKVKSQAKTFVYRVHV